MSQRDDPDLGKRLQQAGLLTSIPFVLLVGPAIGYYLGSALDGRWPHAPWGMAGGIVLGLLASARVTIQLIRQAQQTDTHNQKPTRK
jgi:F0F1-type ATP synthase assembly protein I